MRENRGRKVKGKNQKSFTEFLIFQGIRLSVENYELTWLTRHKNINSGLKARAGGSRIEREFNHIKKNADHVDSYITNNVDLRSS